MKTLPVALALLWTPACEPPPPDPAEGAKHARLVFFAVLEGLYEEGFDPALAKPLVAATETEWFVTKCPLCEPVRFAFELYTAKSYRMGGLAGSGVPKEIVDGFKSPEKARRHKALQALVDRYVERKLARSGLSADERNRFLIWAQGARKDGMQIKPDSFGDYCPSCEGVNLKK